MNNTEFDIPEKAKQLRSQADMLRRRAQELDEEAMDVIKDRTKKFMYKMQDKLLNRTQCLDYLSIGTLESLKNWERKYSPYGYLRFENNKILRSKLLEFIDDLNSGKIHRLMQS